jgi:hypothetical protein
MSTSFLEAAEQATRAPRRFSPEATGLAAISAPCLLLGEPGEERPMLPIPPGWSQIGRSRSAAIRLDDLSGSRRHALLVRTSREQLRIIDDRSLNGLYRNGERIDWAELDDGDELLIGCFRLIIARDRRLEEAEPPALH